MPTLRRPVQVRGCAAGGDAASDFYEPDMRILRLARTLLGDAQFGSHACTVSVAPAPFVCRHHYDRTHVFDNPLLAPSRGDCDVIVDEVIPVATTAALTY